MKGPAMTTPESLLSLAKRVEEANAEQQAALIEEAFWATKPNYVEDRPFRALIAAEAFLDAAMTLVPEGWRPLIDCTPNDKPVVELFADEDVIRPIARAAATTPALALTAASLRALTQGEQK